VERPDQLDQQIAASPDLKLPIRLPKMGRRDLSRLFVCLGFSHFTLQRRPCYFRFMTKLEQIEKSVAALSPEELKAFAA
jgi:hypothetical protein